MGNPVKGEVSLEAEGQGYTLLLDFNALCDLEQDFPGIMQGEFAVTKPSDIRKVFAVGLVEHHPDLPVRQVGKIIHAVGLDRAAELIAESFAASFPEAAKSDASPQKAPAKAGAGSEA